MELEVVMEGQGPFRERDPIPMRVDALEALTKTHGEGIYSHTGELDRVRSRLGRLEGEGVRRAVPWLVSPFLSFAVLYGFMMLVTTLSKGCDEHDAAVTHGLVTNCQTQCTAFGLHYGGFSSFKNTDGFYHLRCVCGDGHGDGLYVGEDGHLHSLRTGPSSPHSSLDRTPDWRQPDYEGFPVREP
jgi:hypothetical protein